MSFIFVISFYFISQNINTKITIFLYYRVFFMFLRRKIIIEGHCILHNRDHSSCLFYGNSTHITIDYSVKLMNKRHTN